MAKQLEQLVMPPFDELFVKHAFTKEYEHYDPQHFGNEVLVFRSPELALKFVKDRSEVSLDVGPSNGSSWYMAPRLFEYLHLAGADLYGPADAGRLERYAAIIEESYDTIVNLFRPENLQQSEADLRRFWKLKAEELFPRDDVSDYGPH